MESHDRPARPIGSATQAHNERLLTQLAVGGLDSTMERAVALQNAVLDAMTAHVAILDRDGLILAVNAAWRAFARDNGFPDEHCGVATNYLSACTSPSGDPGPSPGDGIRAVLSGTRASFSMEYACHGPDRLRWFRLMASPLSAGAVQGAVVMHVDITERILAEQAAERACREAERASRLKSEFLANLSHELRTPLNAVIGYAEMLHMGLVAALEPKQAEYAGDIRNSGQHLLDLINDLIDLSKAEVGVLDIDDGEICIEDLLCDCLRMLAPRARDRALTIARQGRTDGLWLQGDERRMRQVLINVLSNAVKFTPPEGSIAVSAQLGEDGWLCIDVTDTGWGIAADEIEAVLQPFLRSRRKICRDQEGAGLGLPMARQLVEAHGGRFVLASELGTGTTASILLPPDRVLKR